MTEAERESRGAMPVLFTARWYPSYDLPVQGIFVGDLARVARDASLAVSVASWETVADGRPAARSLPAPTLPPAWGDAIAAGATAVVPAGWGVPGIAVARLPAPTRVIHGTRDDAVAVAAAQSEALLAFAASPGFVAPAIVHAHTGLPDGVASIALADRLGVPLVTSEHDSLVVDRLADPRARAAYRQLVEDGRVLLAVSDWQRRRLAEALEVDTGRLGVLPNPVEVEPFLAASGTLPRDPDLLLWVGNRKQSKGTDVLLAAFARLRAERPTLRLRMIGRSPSAAEDERLRALAADLGIADATTFGGQASRMEIARAMAAAAAFVHPSPIETFGIVAAEALAAGLPVAATPSGGVEEIVGTDGRFGEIAADLGDEALAAAVRRVLDRVDTYDRAAMAASVVERFGPERLGDRLLQIYRDAIAARATRPAGTGDVAGPGSAAAVSLPEASPAEVTPIVAVPARAMAEPATRPGYVLVARGSGARAAVTRLPEALLRDLPVLTLRDAAPLPPPADGGPAWIRVDPERTFKAARRKLGGPPPRGSRPKRLLWAATHPRHALGLRRLARDRDARNSEGVKADVAAALAKAATAAGTEVVPLTVDGLELVQPALGARVRLWPGSLRGFVDAWDAAGRPSLGRDAARWGVYDPAAYWSNLHERGDLSAVGQSAFSPEFNAWLYRALEWNLRRFMRRHRVLDPVPGSAFDVGVGIGYWVRLWRSLGIRRVDGCDLVETAVEGVRRATADAQAEGEFVVADIGRAGPPSSRTYPLVSCFNVLLHVTDDAAFDTALANIAALVAPEGSLLLAEPIVFDASQPPTRDSRRHSMGRPLAAYRDPLLAAGLELVAVEHATVLANNPLEAGSAASRAVFERWWGFAKARDRAGSRWIGPIVAYADRLAMQTGAAPTTKFALFRRPRVPSA